MIHITCIGTQLLARLASAAIDLGQDLNFGQSQVFLMKKWGQSIDYPNMVLQSNYFSPNIIYCITYMGFLYRNIWENHACPG